MKPSIPRRGGSRFAGVVMGAGLCATTLLAQNAPYVVQDPVSQTNLAGAKTTLSVQVSGQRPMTYRWRFNGVELPNNIITTIAGTTNAGVLGAGGYATNSVLGSPFGLAADSTGNLFIADEADHRVLKVDRFGVITVMAGNGSSGFGGDGGAATNASLHWPAGAALDPAGNLYVVDPGANRVRKIDASGVISTFAGNGGNGTTGDGGPATNAALYIPSSIAFDPAGNLLIADYPNIRCVSTNGVISTIAGQALIGFSGDGGPATNANFDGVGGLALDAAGNLYISDTGNQRIRKVDTNGVITTLAGMDGSGHTGDGGPATNAALFGPTQLFIDDDENLYIADKGNSVIRLVDATGNISTIAGNGVPGYFGDGRLATRASLQEPSGVAMDDGGNLFIADTGNRLVRKVFVEGPRLVFYGTTPWNAGTYDVVISNAFGSVTSAVAVLGVDTPPSIIAQPEGHYAAVENPTAFEVTASGTGPLSYQWRRNGTNLPTADSPQLAISNVGPTDAGEYDVVVSNLYGSVTSAMATLIAGTPPAIARQPANLTNFAGSTGSLSAAASGDSPINYYWQFNGADLLNTPIATFASHNFPNPVQVAAENTASVLVLDPFANRLYRLGTNNFLAIVAGDGTAGFSGDGGPADAAKLAAPQGFAVDRAGNIYIADAQNERVRKIDTNGIISTVAGLGFAAGGGDGGPATNAFLNSPSDVALAPNGDLLVADSFNYGVRRIDSAGIIRTIAGNRIQGSSGDGGFATNAEMRFPAGLAADALGNIYVADPPDNCVRKIDPAGIITTVAGTRVQGGTGDGGPATSATLNNPHRIALDGVGNLYIADTGNARIRMVDTRGIITTVAGAGTPGYSGDGGPAIKATLRGPYGLAVDPSENILIADSGNGRIRIVSAQGPSLVFPDLSAASLGTYDLIAQNAFGSATSIVVSLQVTLPDLAIEMAGGILQLSAIGAPGASYALQTSPSLLPPVTWRPTLTNATGTNGLWLQVETNLSGAEFYRLSAP